MVFTELVKNNNKGGETQILSLVRGGLEENPYSSETLPHTNQIICKDSKHNSRAVKTV